MSTCVQALELEVAACIRRRWDTNLRAARRSATARASAMAEPPSNRPSGGGTGFLFGNIDKRGRLDEDYMDEDAKDHLDNVAPTVANRDPNLREITEAVPKTTDAAPGSNPNSPTHHDDNAQDFYDDADDDDDLDDLDDTAKSALAARALADGAAKPVNGANDDDDDENYDDDGDDAPAATPAPPPLKPVSSLPAPPPLARIPAPTAAVPGSAGAEQESPSPAPLGVSSEEKLQLELMEAARRGASAAAGQPSAVEDAKPVSDQPLRFSEVLSRPAPRLPSVGRRRRFGIVHAVPPAVPNAYGLDDAGLLEEPPVAPRLDPTKLFLDTDVGYRTEAGLSSIVSGPHPGLIAPARDDKSELASEDRAEYVEAAAPLVRGCTKSVHVGAKDEDEAEAAKHSMLEQATWENEIEWGNSDVESYNSEENDVDEPASRAEVRDEPTAVPAPDAGDDDDDDDDDMEWEEGNAGADDVAVPASSPGSENGPSTADAAVPGGDAGGAAGVPQSRESGVRATSAGEEGKPSDPSSSDKGEKSPGEVGTAPPDDAEKDKAGLQNLEKPTLVPSRTATNAKKAPVVRLKVQDALIGCVLAPNADLASGKWLGDIAWDSDGCGSDSSDATQGGWPALRGSSSSTGPMDRLIYDMNDSNMILEEVSIREEVGEGHPRGGPSEFNFALGNDDGLDGQPGRGRLIQLNPGDPFNISNDPYYARTIGNSMLKVDRRAILRGLRNAPPAVKAQTSTPCPTDDYLGSFHRPRYRFQGRSSAFELQPFRRKRPKGGSSQIAGQIPKKQGELLASAKDAYRICLLEFALEDAPSLVAIPGMASKVVTYDRKATSAAAAQARKDATGTPDADTVFLAPEEMPPLHAGDLTANSKPLLVLESHLFSAPCTRREAAPTDFLVIRRKDKMFVREIDSVLSVGVTEPKVEVMAPNSDRFKKFSRDRVSLWLLRELLKSQKEYQKSMKRPTEDTVGSIERDYLFSVFPRRRSFPETSLGKLLKDLTRYQGGRYNLIAEPPKGFAAMDAEWLRTVSPEETCAFEAMETGWYHLFDVGVQKLTHPSQANIRAAAEKCGLRAGPAVGAFIWNQLLHAPWYRSQIMIAAQKQQRKELLQALASARIVNDLRDGGSIMERRIASLTSAEAANVLVNPYRVQTRKIPAELEARRKMVHEMTMRKGKATEAVEYENVIAGVIEKQHNVNANRTAAGAGVTAAVIAAGVMILPLAVQREALEEGIVSNLPREVDRASTKEDTAVAARIAADGDEAFGTLLPSSAKGAEKRGAAKAASGKEGGTSLQRSKSKSQARDEANGPVSSIENGKARKKSDGSGDAIGAKESGKRSSGEKVKSKKKVKLKLVKKVKQDDGTFKSVVHYITDPEEVERVLAREKAKKSKKKDGGGDRGDGSSKVRDDGSVSAGANKLKINISIGKMAQGSSKPSGKSSSKSKGGAGSLSRKRSETLGKRDSSGGEDGSTHITNGSTAGTTGGVQRVGQKGQVGKIKINQKAVREAQEAQAAKRKRSQYGEDMNYPRKAAKKSSTSRRKRNGRVLLNGILEEVEKVVRETEGYMAEEVPVMKIVRLRPGEKAPHGRTAKNLARPEDTFLDFTIAVNTKTTPAYKEVVKKQMYLDSIKHRCKQMKYNRGEDFLSDFKLLVSNARAFNTTPDVQWVVQHAELLLEVASEEVGKRKDEIAAAESQVLKEKSESAKAAVPTPNASGPSTVGEKPGDDGVGMGSSDGFLAGT